VPVDWQPGPQPGHPRKLFDAAYGDFGFDVSGDGQHFYVIEIDTSAWVADRIDLVLNWFDELRQVR